MPDGTSAREAPYRASGSGVGYVPAGNWGAERHWELARRGPFFGAEGMPSPAAYGYGPEGAYGDGRSREWGAGYAGGYGRSAGYGEEGGYGDWRGGQYAGVPPSWTTAESPALRGRSARDASYAGRGPRGYRRSDERILDDVNEALTRHAGLDPSDIEVRVSAGEVTLSGTVESRRDKRLAEDIADVVTGVVDVHNRLRIARSAEDRTGTRQAPAASARQRSHTRGATERQVALPVHRESASRHARDQGARRGGRRSR
ncbi:MAG TPA: BON domain-containing protein [Gemmatimonadaceae bacterium]|nr:BON domain-containing protein [Gemmatimonadaceae bacterium]